MELTSASVLTTIPPEMNFAAFPSKHSAPGQYLGYALQPVRLCYHLMTAPKGAKVSLEVADDVAVHFADGTILLEQTKSALTQNPISDWADDLWKSVFNWLNQVESGNIKGDLARFCIYVAPSRSGVRAQDLHNAEIPEQVEAIVRNIEKGLTKLKKSPGCMVHLNRFLSATQAARAQIVTRMTIVSDSDPLDPLRKLIELTVAPELIDVVCHAAIGLAKERADYLIRNNQHAIVDADDFRSEFRAFIQRNNLPGYLASFSSIPNVTDVSIVFGSRPVFVRQLELIDVGIDEQTRAVSDYLRTSADKSIWAEIGLVFKANLDEYDDRLIFRFNSIFGEISDLHGHHPGEVRGRLAYRRCSISEAPLDSRAVPGHFTHGCFNALADARRLGWHPEFNNLLDQEES